MEIFDLLIRKLILFIICLYLFPIFNCKSIIKPRKRMLEIQSTSVEFYIPCNL